MVRNVLSLLLLLVSLPAFAGGIVVTPNTASVRVGEQITLHAEDAPGGLSSGFPYDVTFTSEATFVESGTICVGQGAGTLMVNTVGEGHLAPTPDPAVVSGAVTWRIVEAHGLLDGATGLITSTFLLSTEGPEYREYLTAIVFLP